MKCYKWLATYLLSLQTLKDHLNMYENSLDKVDTITRTSDQASNESGMRAQKRGEKAYAYPVSRFSQGKKTNENAAD